MLAVKNTIFLFIRSQSAESGPPLGTVLGNLGLNAVKFCKEFNDFTKELPSYFLLKVKILILEDRSYNFSVFLPTTGFILMFVKFQLLTKKPVKDLKKYLVSLKNIVSLAKLKFPTLYLKKSISIIFGSLTSCNLYVFF